MEQKGAGKKSGGKEYSIGRVRDRRWPGFWQSIEENENEGQVLRCFYSVSQGI